MEMPRQWTAAQFQLGERQGTFGAVEALPNAFRCRENAFAVKGETCVVASVCRCHLGVTASEIYGHEANVHVELAHDGRGNNVVGREKMYLVCRFGHGFDPGYLVLIDIETENFVLAQPELLFNKATK